MKTKSARQPSRAKAKAQLADKTVATEKLTKKNRRQAKIAPPEYRLTNRFRESHREPGVNEPRGR